MARWLELVSLDELLRRPALRNPKNHIPSEIASSIDRHGFVENPAIDERTGRLVAGHGRLDALVARRASGEQPPDGVEVSDDGDWLVPVQRGWASASDSAAEAYVIASNALTINGGWEEDILAEMLKDYADDPDWLTGTGYDEKQVVSFLASLNGHDEQEILGDPDEVAEPPAAPVSKRGDVWLLGDHRAMVGDCRDAADVARVLAGDSVNLAFTSPPYADRREYDESSGFVPIPPEQYVEWFEPVQANVAAHLANDGSWFVNIKASTTPDSLSTELYVLDLVMAHARRWGWHLATEFCWERAGVPKEPTLRFKNQFEPVYQFTRGRWKFRPIHVQHLSDYAVTAMGVGAGNTSWGDPSSDTVSQGQHGDMFDDRRGLGLAYPGNRLPTFAGSHEALGHGAAFPIGLPEFFVKAYTDRGDVVFDPFVGSGSTLMACENQARKGRGIDLSPGYVDVTCRRFQDVTGIIPVLEATGKPHDFSL